MKMSGVIAAALLAGLPVASALADQVQMTNAGSQWYDGGPGGAFRANVVSGYIGATGGPGGSATSFLTFCVEHNENFSFGGTYYTEISDSASGGGVSGGNPDPISARTAQLYGEFRSANSFGNLSGLGGDGISTAAETHALQDAIWFEEGEIATLPAGLATDLWTWAGSNNGTIGIVRVLRLWTNPDLTGNSQDQLTIAPVLVPLPSAAMAGLPVLLGLAGFGVCRRRRLA